MGQELKQLPDGALVVDDDKTGNRNLYMGSNTRIFSSWIGKITATSPGVIVGTGGDTGNGLPGNAVPIGVSYYAPNAGSTGGTITVGIDTTSTYFLNAASVAALASVLQQSPQAVTNLFTQLAALPQGQKHNMTGFFAQTATSTAAGPFFVRIDYYVPDPA